MFEYISLIIFPFNSVCKLNIKSAYIFTNHFYSTINFSDVKQKEIFARTIPLAFASLKTSGFFPIYTKVSKSVSNFKTREGDLIGATSVLQTKDFMPLFETILESDVYLYFETLYRAHFNFSNHSILSLGMPDFRYLPNFKASLLHSLNYAFGYDANLFPVKTHYKSSKMSLLNVLFFSSLYILDSNFKNE